MRRHYYVYILTSRSYTTLYTGMTGAGEARMIQHRNGLVSGFTSRYNVDRLVYLEETQDVNEAIAREKQIKGWTRAKKIALIESMNPEWRDLAEAWIGHPDKANDPTEAPATTPPDPSFLRMTTGASHPTDGT